MCSPDWFENRLEMNDKMKKHSWMYKKKCKQLHNDTVYYTQPARSMSTTHTHTHRHIDIDIVTTYEHDNTESQSSSLWHAINWKTTIVFTWPIRFLIFKHRHECQFSCEQFNLVIDSRIDFDFIFMFLLSHCRCRCFCCCVCCCFEQFLSVWVYCVACLVQILPLTPVLHWLEKQNIRLCKKQQMCVCIMNMSI